MIRLAIIGRPNVGKSTLYNRLVGRKSAIVYDEPGVTRDRQEEPGQLADLNFMVMDTAGLEHKALTDLGNRMSQQTLKALDHADILLFMVDAQGITAEDIHFATLLRKVKKPLFLLANKAEGKKGAASVMDAYSLGIGEPIAISAEHGLGMDDLYEAIKPLFPEEDITQDASYEKPLSLAIVGRPNAGKSTLINRLLGEDRLLTGPEAGITRDAVSLEWTYNGQKIKLIDTAGLRKKSRVANDLETLSVKDTLNAIQYAEAVVLVIDATCPLEKQDLQIARHVAEEGRFMVIVANKWDKIKDKQATLKELQADLDHTLSQVKGIALIPLSALEAKNFDPLMKAVLLANERWNRRIKTAVLNEWLSVMLQKHSLPLIKGRRLKIRYMTQIKTRPPTFSLFISQDVDFPVAYERYLMHGLREHFDLQGIPIRFSYRKGKNPYHEKK